MRKQNRTAIDRRCGFTLIELVITIGMMAISVAAVGILLASSSKGWIRIYQDTHSEMRQDSLAMAASLQAFGRRSNCVNYKIYRISSGSYVEAVPPQGQTVAVGQALELRYWQELYDPEQFDYENLEYTNTGTHYVLYYLDGEQLKADFGRVIDGVGAVSNNSRQTAGLDSTQVLARHVDTSANSNIFIHTFSGGKGNGCINLDVTLTDDANRTLEFKTAVLLRVAWPR